MPVHGFECGDGNWEIWLDTEISDRDGICIAAAPSLDEAMKTARFSLKEALDELKPGATFPLKKV